MGKALTGSSFSTVALALLLVSCADDPLPEFRFSEATVTGLDAALVKTQTDLGVPGMVAYLEVPRTGRWYGRAGVADATGAPMDRRRTIRIGSITKTFTVTLLLRLADDGIVRLDDTVSRWVPGVPNGERITLRQLGNMTAGLPSYTFDDGFQQALFSNPQRVFAPEELLTIGFAEERSGCKAIPQQCFDPGTAFFYSNTNTVLLARVLEVAAQRKYAELLATYITKPLGMNHTYQPADGSMPNPHVQGITSQGTAPGEKTRDATGWNPSWAFGVGDLVSTVDDLIIWARALGTGALLSEAMKEERFTKVTFPPYSETRAYALGIGYSKGWWGHSGEIPGYNTTVYYRPDIDAVLVVSASRDETEVDGKGVGPAAKLADAIVDIAAKDAPLGDIEIDSPNEL